MTDVDHATVLTERGCGGGAPRSIAARTQRSPSRRSANTAQRIGRCGSP